MRSWARPLGAALAVSLAFVTQGGAVRAAQEEIPPAHVAPRRDLRVTKVEIKKGAHTLRLLAGEAVVANYKVAIGPGGAGPKLREGDRVTPVGRYHVVSHAPSQFHVFLRLDYPNADDRARFAKLKREGTLDKRDTIGGDVGIHGAPAQLGWKKGHKEVDWTLGCIALDDDEIEEVASLVKDGTEVDIAD